MPDLGDSITNELDEIALSYERSAGSTSPRVQLGFVLRRLGPRNVANVLRTTGRRLVGWLGGTIKPTPESRRRIQNLYQLVRRDEVIRRHRGKVKARDMRAQISGTITFSDPEYRTNFGGTLRITAHDMAPVIAAWKRGQTLAAGAAFEIALQNASNVPNARFEHDDYQLDLF